MFPAFMKNIGAFLFGFPSHLNTTVLAGGGADGVSQDGLTIDRQSVTPTFLSGKFLTQVACTLATDETVTVRQRFQDSADDSVWAAYVPTTGGDELDDVVISSTGNSIVPGNVDFSGARRYVRQNVTLTQSAANTDTADFVSVLASGGSAETPAS